MLFWFWSMRAPVQTLTCPLPHTGTASYSFSKHLPRQAQRRPSAGTGALSLCVSAKATISWEQSLETEGWRQHRCLSKPSKWHLSVLYGSEPLSKKEQAENTVVNLKFTSNILIGVFTLWTKVILSFNAWFGRCYFIKEKSQTAQRIHVVKIKTPVQQNNVHGFWFREITKETLGNSELY